MKTKLTLFLIFIYAGFVLKAQENTHSSGTFNLYTGVGGVYSDYQDVKFSDVRFSGIRGRFQLGFQKEKTDKYLWDLSMDVDYGKEHAQTHNIADVTIINSFIFFKYLRVINENFLLGGRVDFLDLSSRTDLGLMNNGSSVIMGNSLYASATYRRPVINDNWLLEASIDFSLMTLQDELPSFAAPYSQNLLENGEATYENYNTSLPDYKDAKFYMFWNNSRIQTEINLKFKSRLSFSYIWRLRRFSVVDDYPTTMGSHTIVVRYNIVHRVK